MSKQKKSRMAGWSDYVTSTISVTLVLFILGLVGVVNITFNGLSRHIKENMGFTVVLTDSVPDETLATLQAKLSRASYVSSYKYMSADEVLADETNGHCEELVDLLGVNPFAPMIEVKVKERYADADSVTRLTAQWEHLPEVAEVSANTEMIGNLNRNARLLNLGLIIMAAALLFISFVLINNTVRLTVYSRRFLIHTMKLVGAKGSFILRPFLAVNALQGLIAGLLASGMLAGLVAWSHTFDDAMERLVTWGPVGITMGGMVLLGILICVLAAALATNRYLRKNYDEMFD